jgi:Skp family chaperone for outer membrane proteins
MSKKFLPAALLAASLVAAPAFADASVLVVDFNQVFQSSAAAQSGLSQIHSKYDAAFNQRKAAFQSAATAYNSQVEAVQKATKPGTQPTATPALQQAGQRAQEARDQLEAMQDEVNQVSQYIRAQIIDKAGPVAEQIRNERKASVVISKEATLASDPSADITSVLIQRLNTSFATPSITLPQQGAPAAGATPAPARPTQGR